MAQAQCAVGAITAARRPPTRRRILYTEQICVLSLHGSTQLKVREICQQRKLDQPTNLKDSNVRLLLQCNFTNLSVHYYYYRYDIIVVGLGNRNGTKRPEFWAFVSRSPRTLTQPISQYFGSCDWNLTDIFTWYETVVKMLSQLDIYYTVLTSAVWRITCVSKFDECYTVINKKLCMQLHTEKRRVQ